VAQATCGVIKQFFAESSGVSADGGLVDSTSNAATAIFDQLKKLFAFIKIITVFYYFIKSNCFRKNFFLLR